MDNGNSPEVLQRPVLHVVALDFPPEQAVAGVAGAVLQREHGAVIPAEEAAPGHELPATEAALVPAEPELLPADTDLPADEHEASQPQPQDDTPGVPESDVNNDNAKEKPAQTPVVRGHLANFSGYLVKIGEVPLLTADEERELAKIIERGSEAQSRIDDGENTAAQRRAVRAAEAAKDRFIRANLRLVVSVARKYTKLPPGTTIDDLVQEGNLGLEHAVDKFNWHKGFKFSTYATFWIRQAIGRYIDEKSTLIHIPGARASNLRQALKYADGDQSQLTEEQDRIDRLNRPLYLDAPIDDDEDDMNLWGVTPDTDVVSTEEAAVDNVIADEYRSEADKLLDVLSEKQRRAVTLYYGRDCGYQRSYREVGEILGITADSAGGLVRRALLILKKHAGVISDDES